MTARFPKDGSWTQDNKSDKHGSIWSSLNLDLTRNLGALRVSPRTRLLNDNTTDLGITAGFVASNNPFFVLTTNYWAVSGKYVWNVSSTNGYATFAKAGGLSPDGTTTAKSCADDLSDIITVNKPGSPGTSYVVATTNTDIYYYDTQSSVWANILAGTLNAGSAHKMCAYAAKIYVTDLNLKIKTFTTAFSGVSNGLDLSNGGFAVTSITTILPVSDGIWVFTINENERGCWAFKWDGVTATDPNSKYFIPDASGILAGVIINDTPWVIDNNGRLLVFNGGTFTEAPSGQLPTDPTKFLKNSLSRTNNRWIHPNGISTNRGRINILINNENADSGATIQENLPSGIWEYDSSIGWYHKMGLSQYTSSITDYGQNRLGGVGALYIAKPASTSASSNGTILAGAQYYSDASSTRYGIWTNDANDTIQKYGYIVTPKVYSEEIEDLFQRVFVRHKKLLDASDSIIIKYRIDDIPPTEVTITWTSTSTFTTTADLSAYAVGDEVEIIQGAGGGKCAQIITLPAAVAGTYTVTLDDTFTGATGTAKARFQKWKKIATQTSLVSKFSDPTIGDADTWIQVKVCMQFKGKDELDDITLATETSRKAD